MPAYRAVAVRADADEDAGTRSARYRLEHIDFIALYRDLGLAPGCTLDELKTAYRRQVSALHPDRPGDPASVQPDAARLQQLTVAYTAVTRFQRQHGRMPGAVAAPTRGPVPVRGHAPATRVAGRSRRWPWPWPWLVLAACAAISLVAATRDGEDDSQPPQAVARPAPDVLVFAREHAAPLPEAAPARIELGASAETVRAIEGRPLMENAGRWDYGPSWIAFSDGKVSDWYSSRLRPLKVGSARPAPAPPR